MSLMNKVAIVTGASSGIGAATAIKLAEEGAKVVLVGRNKDKLKLVSAKCEEIGVKPLTIIADVSKDDDAKRIVNETINYFGQLDILVNNAGLGEAANIIDDNAMKVYDKIMSTNLRGAIHLTHLSVKHLGKTKGNVINISSIAGIVPMMMFSYCVSKAGLDHFTRCAALELAPLGIRVNGINPGPVRTHFLANMGIDKEDTVWNNISGHTLLKRVGDSEEIADLVVFMASDKGRSLTGASFVSDNGASLLGPIMALE